MTAEQGPPPSPTPGLSWLNGADERAVRHALRRVCASSAWGRRVLAERPFARHEALLVANDTATAALTDEDLAEAIGGHPPIGRPEDGDAASAREQAGMAGAPADLKAEMLALNLAYQDRFGHVFLICATGLTAEQLRDALRLRLGNSPDAEREIVRAELGKINRIRLTRLVGSAATVSTHVLDTARGRPATGVPVTLSAAAAPAGPWVAHAASLTDEDGRCAQLPALPGDTALARLTFAVEPYLAGPSGPGEGADAAFFPEAAVVFSVVPGEHYHVPLLLSPFGYSVYRGS
ncbi:2-oxo-4-hydroxy-4-carboxy-5-ureidoimidazoline decarboxylase [Streptomyces sp. PT12]|uniref:2-oxo-4-hydroxy-4-carboxy-5-ureidoimidazoline decarboxylase n=1 Tax=Streptomyces sp. PT12 TaxID=1510197 RepID=UPI0015EF02A1|nr:2-oxo-4-hydroxy-4-carboxy-5-ureidoimidazoline decarboxylase [Streptomyces sp. PT12]